MRRVLLNPQERTIRRRWTAIGNVTGSPMVRKGDPWHVHLVVRTPDAHQAFRVFSGGTRYDAEWMQAQLARALTRLVGTEQAKRPVAVRVTVKVPPMPLMDVKTLRKLVQRIGRETRKRPRL